MNEKGSVILGFFLIAVMLVGAGFLILWIWENVNVNVIVSLGTAILALISTLWIKKIENKHAIEAQFRDKKARLFLKFRRALDDLFAHPEGDFDLVGQLKDTRAKLLFWGGPDTVNAYEELVATMKGFAGLSTVKHLFDASCAIGEFYLAMRKDLGLSNRGLTAENLGLSVIRNPELVSRIARENPDMSINEFTRLEEELERV